MGKKPTRIIFPFLIAAVFFLAAGRDCSAASAPISIGLEVRSSSTIPAPEISIQELDDYSARIYGKSVSEGEIHLRIEGEGGYEEDVVVNTSYSGNWEYIVKKLNAGTYQVRAFSVDGSYQQSQTSDWKDFRVTMEPPQFSVSVGAVSQRLRITGTAFPEGKVQLNIFMDGEEIIQTEVQVDASGDWVYTRSGLPAGDYEIGAYAFDSHSNRSDRSSMKSFEIKAARTVSTVSGGTAIINASQPGQGTDGAVVVDAEPIPIRSLVSADPGFSLNLFFLALALFLLGWLLIALKRYYFAWKEERSPHLIVAIREGSFGAMIRGVHFPEGKVRLGIFTGDNKEVKKVEVYANKKGKLSYYMPSLRTGTYSVHAYSPDGSSAEEELLAKVNRFRIGAKRG